MVCSSAATLWAFSNAHVSMTSGTKKRKKNERKKHAFFLCTKKSSSRTIFGTCSRQGTDVTVEVKSQQVLKSMRMSLQAEIGQLSTFNSVF